MALSHWSVLLGLPLPLWGALGFLAIGVAAHLRSAWLLPLTLLAAVGSVALLGVELVAIGSLCLLCEAVHVVCLALALLVWQGRKELGSLRDRDHAALVLLPPIGLMLGLVLFLQPYWKLVGWKGDLPFNQGKTTEGQPWIGAKQPKLTVQEYTDYACAHCKLASAWTLKRLAAHEDTIRIVRGQAPRMRCPAGQKSSCQAVRMAYCAEEQGRFWQMDRWLFQHAPRELDTSAAAKDVGLVPERFATCTERADIYERAEREAADAMKRRIVNTPTYMVDGKRVASEVVDRLLERGLPD